MVGLQSAGIFVLNNTGKITTRLPSRAQKIILTIFIFLLTAMFSFRISAESIEVLASFNDGPMNIIACFILLFIIIFSVKEPLHRIKIRKISCVIYFLPFALIAISGIKHSIGASVWLFVLIVMFGFPILALILKNNGDIEKFFKTISWCMLICGIIFFILCMYFYPIADGGGRYQGPTINPNSLGMYAASILISSLYLLAVSKGPKLIFISISMLLSSGLIVLSESRTSMLIGLASLLIVLIGIAKSKFRDRHEKGTTKLLLQRMLALVLACVLCVSIPTLLLSINPAGLQNKAPAEETAVTDKVAYSGEIKVDLSDRMDTDGKTLNSLSSGRIAIWKETVKTLNWLGHDSNTEPFLINELTDAHLVPLMIAYISGIPAGISYLLLELFFLIAGIVNFLQKKKKIELTLYFCLSVCSYFIFSSLEVMMSPFRSGLTFCFFLVASLFLYRDSDMI